jgi:hypothetical protein
MRRSKKSLSRSSAFDSEDINPMEGVANLSDVMLVFSCGLMLALMMHWNIDVGGQTASSVPVTQGQEITDSANIDSASGKPLSGSEEYQEYGKVYQDPATGKLYMVKEN